MKKKLNEYEKAVQLVNESFAQMIVSKKQLIFRSLLQGLFFGLGTTVGVSIILLLVSFTINQLKGYPLLDAIIKETKIEEVITR